MERYKFNTTKKLKNIHRKMIASLGVENIRYEYEHFYFSIKPEKKESVESHFKKIGLVLFSII